MVAPAAKPLDPGQLRALIQKTLKPLALYSANAEELLMATCAQESLMGVYRRQLNDGPAMGIFQMEPEDFNDIWSNYLLSRPLGYQIAELSSTSPPRPVEMLMNDPFAICMARVHYLRAPGELPDASDLTGIWNYYKQFYNTPAGAATQAQFFDRYKLTKGAAT